MPPDTVVMCSVPSALAAASALEMFWASAKLLGFSND